MSTIVYRMSVLLSAILADVPVGTNLGLFWLLWALISGRFLLSRGAVFPALADGGLPADAVRRSGAAIALPAIVLAVGAAVGSVGKVRLPLLRLVLRADPSDGGEAALQRRALRQAGAALQADEVLVVDAGFGVAELLMEGVPRFVARVARNFTARSIVLPAYHGRGRRPAYGALVRP